LVTPPPPPRGQGEIEAFISSRPLSATVHDAHHDEIIQCEHDTRLLPRLPRHRRHHRLIAIKMARDDAPQAVGVAGIVAQR